MSTAPQSPLSPVIDNPTPSSTAAGERARVRGPRVSRRLQFGLVLAACAIFVAPTRATEPHPFHVSMAEVEYNPQSKALEVALKLYAVDAEQALRRIKDKATKFDFDTEAQRDKLLKKYLPTRFSVRTIAKPNKPAPKTIDPVSGRALAPGKNQKQPTPKAPAFRYVGSETDGAWVWAYFELPVDLSRGQFELSNTVLNEIQLEQLNVVAFKPLTGRAQTIYFDRKKPTQPLVPRGPKSARVAFRSAKVACSQALIFNWTCRASMNPPERASFAERKATIGYFADVFSAFSPENFTHSPSEIFRSSSFFPIFLLIFFGRSFRRRAISFVRTDLIAPLNSSATLPLM